jgi:tRNA threonylcarbamoyladenosine biosynthesis protein TsaE
MEFDVSLDQLDRFAEQFWERVKGARVFVFHGAMGAGKTTLITALCRNKGVEDTMGSPTFSIINEYAFHEKGSLQKLYHIDLYRLKDEEEVVQAGVEDCVYSGFICMVEWPEKAPHVFDADTIHVLIQPLSETRRRVGIKLPLSL